MTSALLDWVPFVPACQGYAGYTTSPTIPMDASIWDLAGVGG